MKKNIKIIALDMDGCVNSREHVRNWINQQMQTINKNQKTEFEVDLQIRRRFIKQFADAQELIFPDLAKRVTQICIQTDCYILWTTTWRKLDTYKDDINVARNMFNRRGLPGDRLIAYTPQIGMSWQGSCRGSQIKSWIKNNEEYNIIKCAVIDDRVDAGQNLPLNAKYFWIDECIGITEYNKDEIIKYLNED